jgi:hypothetical protein
MAKIEEELALIVRSKDPKGVADMVAVIKKIGEFTLVPQPPLKLVDTYYDTSYGAVKNAKSSVRIRVVDENDSTKTLVTVKGGNFSFGDVSKRVEHEFEWPFDIKPEEVFGLFELKPIQKRINYRQPRFVYYNKAKSQKLPLAELVIDEFTYKFNSGTSARLYEIEIEAKNTDPDVDIRDISDLFLKKFPKVLRPWKASKLSMGKLIELALDINTDETDLLNDSSFDAIERILA